MHQARTRVRLLHLSWGTSAVATWTFQLALAVLAFQEAGVGGVGAAGVASTLPAGLVSPLAGMLVDRLRRWDVVVGTLALRAVLTAGVLATAAADLPFALLLVLAAAENVVRTGHKPAHAALLLDAARSPDELARVNAVWAGLDNATFMLASLLVGAVLAWQGAGVAVGLAAGVFLLALLPTLLLARDAVPAYRAAARGPGDAAGSGVRRGVAGVLAVLRDAEVRLVILLMAVGFTAVGMINVFVVVLAVDVFDLGEDGVGWLNAAWGVGGAAAAGVALRLLAGGRLPHGLAVGLLLLGVPVAVVGGWSDVGVGVAMIVLVGLGFGLVEAAGQSLLQRVSSDEVLGRTFALLGSAYLLCGGLGAVLVPLLLERLTVGESLLLTGAVVTVTTAACWPRLARLRRETTPAAADLVLLRRVEVFGALPMLVVETMAVRTRHRHAERDEVVVRAGDPGTEFFVVVDGEVAVSDTPAPVPPLGAGDYFGEIALLLDTTRTATITATRPSDLLVLDREAFATACGGHAYTGATLQASAQTRVRNSRF